MKIGLCYKDDRTNEILKCLNYTYSYHVFLNQNGITIERGKYNVYKRVTNKKEIEEFEQSVKDKPYKYVEEPPIFGWDNILAFNTIYE